ncbi:orotidine-5'-phosphate decarboxylase [Paenibacillus psychroresistens]|uniref:Orotidine 5'-phosphate decarboxylase n=2 Tax=Paenibacillus psychroresistens TaxID=1778678 RepID=A0A6B8RWN2_9BACL|nr:orotidine-5'-phosphate decarboxylase [Paenibacillus psychroresistens]
MNEKLQAQGTTKDEDHAGRIMVALDYSSADEAKLLLKELQGIPCYMKVGMQLFYAAGPSFVLYLKEQGYKVFLDLKMHDIPNTVKGGAESLTRLGVDMFNIHAAGGKLMLEAALEGVDKGLTSGKAERPLVIAVTQLTSTSQQMLNDEIGLTGTVEQAVLKYAQLAQAADLDGVVASPHEVLRIKQQLGSSFITVTPGIRPTGAAIGDQSRVMTPQEAFSQGTDYIVIGRPITAATDPRKALETILEELI